MHRYEARFPEVSANGRYFFREWYLKNICKRAKGILVDSEVGRLHVNASYGISTSRVHVLPYVPAKYIYEAQVLSDIKDKYQLPSKYIFYPAHFSPHKNHKNLIHAVSLLTNEIPDMRLVLIGRKIGKYYNRMLRLVERLKLSNHLLFIDYVPNEEMPSFYRYARAMIMPTFFGPTNIPPLEAFVLGCPCATSAIYGIPEQVGDAALLFDPEDVRDIANCIRRLWLDDNLCETLKERGLARSKVWGPLQFSLRLAEIIDRVTD